MRSEGDEEDLRRLFGELKARDRRGAPSFDSVMASARARGRWRIHLPLRAAAAVLLLVAVAAAALLIRNANRAEQVAIGSWRSPTEWLLTMRSTSLDSVPDVRASVIELNESAANTTSPRAGHAKGDTI